jgi:hypothetical protein
VFDI